MEIKTLIMRRHGNTIDSMMCNKASYRNKLYQSGMGENKIEIIRQALGKNEISM